MSSHHLAPDLIPHYLDALSRYRIVYLVGYPSSLHTLAQEALRLGRRDLKMTVVLTNAEPLLNYQREEIARAFQCPVRETYGMGENVAAATECEQGRLHQWPEAGIIEVVDADRSLPLGEFGEFICTGLMNLDMPFIRYRLGDSGRLAAAEERCACGRTLPLITSIDGRTNDMLLTADGRRVFWLNPVLYGIPIRQAQFVQEALDRVRIRYAPTPAFTTEAGESMATRLRARMGDIEVVLEQVSELPRTNNGKIQTVICNLSPADQRAVLERRRTSAGLSAVRTSPGGG